MARKQVSRKRRVKRILKMVAHIRSTFNTYNVTITDEFGNASGASAGALDSKDQNQLHLQLKWLQKLLQNSYGTWFENSRSNSKGPGPGRESAIRALIQV